MKKITFTLLLAISATSIVAQPTITSIDVSPAAGDTIVSHIVSGPRPSIGGNGPNQVWDYSNLTSTNAIEQRYLPPSSTPFGGMFSAANLCIIGSDTLNRYIYFSSNTSSFTQIGTASVTGATFNMTTGISIYKFPIVYNNNNNNNNNSQHLTNYLTSSTTSITTTMRSHQNWNCVGYGKLILPTGTYHNVLKVNYTNVDTQMTINSITKIGWDTATFWFCPGVHGPALRTAVAYVKLGANASVTRVEAGAYTSQTPPPPLQQETI